MIPRQTYAVPTDLKEHGGYAINQPLPDLTSSSTSQTNDAVDDQTARASLPPKIAKRPKMQTMTGTDSDGNFGQETRAGSSESPLSSRNSSTRSYRSLAGLSPAHPDMRTHTFWAAASLLRDATDLDGAIFFDIPSVSSQHDRQRSFEPSTTPEDTENQKLNTDTHSLESHDGPHDSQSQYQSHGQYCRRLGCAFCVVSKVYTGGVPDGNVSLPVDVIQSLLYHFPKGAIFNLERLQGHSPLTYESIRVSDILYPTQKVGAPSQATASLLGRSSVERELRSCLPASCSIIFHPLRNSRTESWYAACLAWSNDSRRILQSSDLSYVIAFSNSIMAEIVNLELLAIDSAKSDFISSISHEIRSPLHGILGSAEMLLDTTIDKEQRDLVQVVEHCDQNLLDTMDNM